MHTCIPTYLPTYLQVSSLSTAVDVMAFYEQKMRVVIITRNLFLSQLQVGR